jgi:hypothetical protein
MCDSMKIHSPQKSHNQINYFQGFKSNFEIPYILVFIKINEI